MTTNRTQWRTYTLVYRLSLYSSSSRGRKSRRGNVNVEETLKIIIEDFLRVSPHVSRAWTTKNNVSLRETRSHITSLPSTRRNEFFFFSFPASKRADKIKKYCKRAYAVFCAKAWWESVLISLFKFQVFECTFIGTILPQYGLLLRQLIIQIFPSERLLKTQHMNSHFIAINGTQPRSIHPHASCRKCIYKIWRHDLQHLLWLRQLRQ